jgi:outer membrane cobalamin receptor
MKTYDPKNRFCKFFMLISFSLFSQEVEVLDEIVVTATKTEHKVLEVPARVELLPAYMLKTHNIFMVDDILSQVSGVNVSRTEGV